MAIDPKKIRKVLLISFSNIGDAVLSLPVLEQLKNRFSNAEIHVWVGSRAAVVFEGDKGITRLWKVSRARGITERLHWWKTLKREDYDLVIDLRCSIFQFLGRYRIPFRFPKKGMHKRDQHLAVLTALGIPVSGRALFNDAKRPLSMNGVQVVIAPGARSHIKCWPKQNFAELADRLIDEWGAEVTWIGDKADQEIVSWILKHMRNASNDLTGKASWIETNQHISACDLLITNDSAPLHAADHQQKRVVAFFGPTDPQKYGPQNTHGALSRNKFCSPCEKARCRFDLECMKEITVEGAFKKALKILREEPKTVASPQNILIIRLDRLGDALLSYPAIASVRAQYPAAHITVVSKPYTKDVFERCKDIDEVIVYDYSRKGAHRSLVGYARLIIEIKKHGFKKVFVFHPNIRSHLLSFLAGIPFRAGFATRGSYLLTHRLKDQRHLGLMHESESLLDLIALDNIKPTPTQSRFRTFKGDALQAEELLQKKGCDKPFVVFNPSSSSRSKEWPWEYFVELGRMIQKEKSYQIVLIGDPSKRHQEIKSQLSDCVDLSGLTPLPVLAALFKKAQGVISTDSGPAHLAAMVGAPVVSIFGRKNPGLSPKRWKPLGKKTITFHKDVGCVICLADNCPIDFECLKAISPEEVFKSTSTFYGKLHEHPQIS
jgi:heptosyltransferase II